MKKYNLFWWACASVIVTLLCYSTVFPTNNKKSVPDTSNEFIGVTADRDTSDSDTNSASEIEDYPIGGIGTCTINKLVKALQDKPGVKKINLLDADIVIGGSPIKTREVRLLLLDNTISSFYFSFDHGFQVASLVAGQKDNKFLPVGNVKQLIPLCNESTKQNEPPKHKDITYIPPATDGDVGSNGVPLFDYPLKRDLSCTMNKILKVLEDDTFIDEIKILDTKFLIDQTYFNTKEETVRLTV